MKKNTKKIIGALVAILGPVAALSSAYALYVSKPSDKTISIGMNTSADVNLTLGDISASTGSLAPDNPMVYTASAGGTAQATYTQPMVVGNIIVTVKTQHATLLNNVDAWVDMGYADDTYAKANFTPVFGAVATEGLYQVITAVSDLVVVELSGRDVKVNLALKNTVTPLAFINNLSEASYSIDIQFKHKADMNYAYIAGNMPDSNWGEVDKYQMIPMIESANFEWVYYGFYPEIGTEFKCRRYDAGLEVDVYSGGDNYEVTALPTNGNNVYWTGGASDPLSTNFYP